MNKNPIIPFGIIAVVGILLVIVFSTAGVFQRADIEKAEEGDTEQQEDAQEEAVEEPEAIFESNCASCHGDDLSGGMGPDLTDVGSRLSEEEIHEIIMEGKGDMPPGLATEAESEVLSEWLSDME
ncbi:MAG TPA: cytochrome c [Bacillota bacterium]|nr:cytochrome c [Bacillota bacterium]